MKDTPEWILKAMNTCISFTRVIDHGGYYELRVTF
jgi:hypothetical protein